MAALVHVGEVWWEGMRGGGVWCWVVGGERQVANGGVVMVVVIVCAGCGVGCVCGGGHVWCAVCGVVWCCVPGVDVVGVGIGYWRVVCVGSDARGVDTDRARRAEE